eukprot:gene8434-9298_t
MGSTSSTLDHGLTKEQKAFITQKLKKIYDENLLNQDEATLNKTLTSEYSRLVESFQRLNIDTTSTKVSVKEQPSPSVAPTPRARQSILKSSFGNNNNNNANPSSIRQASSKAETPTNRNSTAKGKGSRRRSFDFSGKDPGKTSSSFSALTATDASVNAISQAVNDAVNTALAVSRSATDNITLQEVTDSWDSVTTQPFCEICKMAFKSVAFLDRHIKFSSLHSDNVKKQAEMKTAAAAAAATATSPVASATTPNGSGGGKDSVGTTTTATTVPPPSILTSPPKPVTTKEALKVVQEEGTHYRLLYSGSKFYWRSKESVDFDLYHHFLAHAVEVIPFHTGKQKELPRFYLDYEAILEAVSKSVDNDVDKTIESMKKEDRFADIPERDQLREDFLVKKFVTYILQRLRFENGICDFFPSFADDPEHFPVLEKRPVVLVPINITRRRKSSAEEIQETLLNINDDRQAISASLEKANQFTSDGKANMIQKMAYSNKIAGLVYNAACYLSAKPWYSLKSKNMKRWLHAIDKVIRNNMVRKARVYLDKKGLNIAKGLPQEQLALQPSLPSSHCRCARITPLTEEVPHVHQPSLDEPFHGLDFVHTKGFASIRHKAVVDAIDRLVKKNFKVKTQTEPRIPLKVLPSPPQPPAPEDPAPTTTTGDHNSKDRIRQEATREPRGSNTPTTEQLA